MTSSLSGLQWPTLLCQRLPPLCICDSCTRPQGLTKVEINLYRSFNSRWKGRWNFNSSKRCDIKLAVISYQTCLNTFGSPPSKHRILQSQFSSPVWCCWRYLAGWLLLAGKKQDTKVRIKSLQGYQILKTTQSALTRMRYIAFKIC